MGRLTCRSLIAAAFFIGLVRFSYGQATITVTPSAAFATTGTVVTFGTGSLSSLTAGDVLSYTIKFDAAGTVSRCAVLGTVAAGGTLAAVGTLPGVSNTYSGGTGAKTATINVYPYRACAVGSEPNGTPVATGTATVTVSLFRQ